LSNSACDQVAVDDRVDFVSAAARLVHTLRVDRHHPLCIGKPFVETQNVRDHETACSGHPLRAAAFSRFGDRVAKPSGVLVEEREVSEPALAEPSKQT